MAPGGETPCLWIITDQSMFGFSIEKLMGLGKGGDKIDWKSLPTIPSCSDFYRNDLPEFALNPLFYDSKIFLANGSSKIYQPFFKKDDQDSNKQLLEISEAPPTSIPSLPINQVSCTYFANVGGKVYFLAYDRWRDMPNEAYADEGFWVLDPSIGQWEPLEFPIPIDDKGFQGAPYFDVFDDKLLFKINYLPERRDYMYCFDFENRAWQQMDDVWENYHFISTISLAVPYPNRVVGLTWRRGLDDPSKPRVKVCAVLLDGDSILYLQQLDELYMGIKSPFLGGYNQEVKFVELEDGMVCALLSGNKKNRSLLWVLVFSLSWSAHVDLELNDVAPSGEKRGKFLDVQLHVNRLYYLPTEPGWGDGLQRAFFTGYPSQKGTAPPPWKRLKADVEISFEVNELEKARALNPSWILDPKAACIEKSD